mmetsp:Transcript_30832/g.47255  ORF Transcript_30832/g.47255 Transcript_30832/m.47255 type:complete len:233 (+) Transcript_30832:109-807(+)|eukprot:CAMPEP_0118701842 /NCGR_PEP_ID=MMETSP0800-20121206/17509_1 /TAXON_ID=210618 ORGANISM="Striatella unipunctata, Strain CCMP2910" /NCGR_SAMPLE_ID=MMETSP0800 /ASSEMBLY_ACC=CAM_ASM_000638 /LENGTH=232 /DNA_ID=CAMNT_0006602875 /DNA_START=62 /DNA_END=760 /DNA_ORIENTATION=+
MKLSATIILATVGAACAFAPSTSNSNNALLMSTEPTETVEEPVVPIIPAINGWTPDAALPLYGLPGSSSPLGFFDPLGFSKGKELTGAKRLREAEVMHGRVAMMATVGYLIGENTPTIAYGFSHPTIANNQIPEVPGTVLFPFFLAINIAEALRASRGWVEPGLGDVFTLRENYYPGDLGFDPLGLKPKIAKDFENMQTKELNNGRLAMLAAAGMCAQEQVNGKAILENLGF